MTSSPRKDLFQPGDRCVNVNRPEDKRHLIRGYCRMTSSRIFGKKAGINGRPCTGKNTRVRGLIPESTAHLHRLPIARLHFRDAGWDLFIRDYRPGFSQYHDGDNETTVYHRLGGVEPSEPLLLSREFHGARPSYMELCEQFRLYHNLYWTRQSQVS